MNKSFLLLIICFGLQAGQVFAQYYDDTTFLGCWELQNLTETDDITYIRSKQLDPLQPGFQITVDGKVLIRKFIPNDVSSDFQGDWWSLGIGHFDFQYYDTSIRMNVIERFEYITEGDRLHIVRVDYEEEEKVSDSRFSNTYWKEVSNEGGKMIYVECTSLENNGIYLSPDGENTRRLQAKKNKYEEMFGSWWPVEDNYFDMQYYNPAKKRIIMEGFEILDNETPVKIVRTRYEEIEEE